MYLAVYLSIQNYHKISKLYACRPYAAVLFCSALAMLSHNPPTASRSVNFLITFLHYIGERFQPFRKWVGFLHVTHSSLFRYCSSIDLPLVVVSTSTQYARPWFDFFCYTQRYVIRQWDWPHMIWIWDSAIGFCSAIIYLACAVNRTTLE